MVAGQWCAFTCLRLRSGRHPGINGATTDKRRMITNFQPRALVRPLPALLLLSLAVGMPSSPGEILGPAHWGLAPELCMLAGMLAILGIQGRYSRRWGPALLSLITFPILILHLADWVAQMVAGRTLQPLYDLALLPALWDVLVGSVGLVPLILLFCSVPGLLLWGLFLAYRDLLASLAVAEGRGMAVGVALLVPSLSLVGLPGAQPFSQGVAATLEDQWQRVKDGRQAQQVLSRALATDPLSGIPAVQLFSRLRGHPLVLIWVESYGQSALTDPRQAPLVSARLSLLEEQLKAEGFHMLSGLVDSPVLGGRSWLAHGTLRAGVRQEQPVQQGAVLASGRTGLVTALQQSGWQTVAVMPGLRGPWPEGRVWGFDKVFNASDLGYGGPAYGWSPMPDQALFAALDRIGPFDKVSTYLELVLTSSHAPWTPLPPWKKDAVGLADGSAYVPPEEADYTRMAESYGQSLDYSLRAAGDWLIRSLPDNALVLMLGDHPALGWIADPATTGHHVPLHILSKDGALVEMTRQWGLSDGMVPPADAPTIPMQDLLGKLVTTYSGPKPGGV